MLTILWILLGTGIVILLMVIVAVFGGKGHLDVERSQNHYAGEVDMFYHSPH